MGGRGSSSGRAGGTIAVSGKAADAKMPQLTGSAKQILWAQQIRSVALANADNLVENVRQNNGRTDMLNPSLASAIQVRKDTVSALQQITSASQLIDRRSALDYSKLKGYALNYDRKNKK